MRQSQFILYKNVFTQDRSGAKKKGHTNFFEHCDFMKKYILPLPHMKTQTEIYLDLICMRISFFKALKSTLESWKWKQIGSQLCSLLYFFRYAFAEGIFQPISFFKGHTIQ